MKRATVARGRLRVELLSPDRGLKALMRRAGKIGARFAIIIGDNEVARGSASTRSGGEHAARSAQHDLIDELIAALRAAALRDYSVRPPA